MCFRAPCAAVVAGGAPTCHSIETTLLTGSGVTSALQGDGRTLIGENFALNGVDHLSKIRVRIFLGVLQCGERGLRSTLSSRVHGKRTLGDITAR